MLLNSTDTLNEVVEEKPPVKEFTFPEWTSYLFYEESLKDAEEFAFNIEQELAGVRPEDPENLQKTLSVYKQEIVDLRKALLYYDGIEKQFKR